MTHDEMEQRITDLLFRITHANDCFLLYRHLFESRKDHLDAMNVAPAFFQITQYSLQHTFMIELAKLSDDRKNNNTGLKKLFNQCRQNKKLFLTQYENVYIDCETDQPIVDSVKTINVLGDINRLEQEFEEKAPLLAILKGQRGKWYAHLDKGFQTPGKVDEAFLLSLHAAEELLELAERICNKLLADLNRGVVATSSSNVYDVDELFERVERANEKLQ